MQKYDIIFLDRDGIINQDLGYVFQRQHFKLVDGVETFLQFAKKNCHHLIIITNQSGIGRGYYTKNDFYKLTDYMLELFAKKKIFFSDVLFCPHHPTLALGKYKKNCRCRKPNPGLVNLALLKYNASPARCIMIGDKITDIQAANSAHLRASFMRNTNTKNILTREKTNFKIFNDYNELTELLTMNLNE